MTGPTPEIPSKAKTLVLMRWPLLVIAIVGILYTWLAGWPSVAQRRAAIEKCRRQYAQARAYGDTVRVDAFPLGEGGGTLRPSVATTDGLECDSSRLTSA